MLLDFNYLTPVLNFRSSAKAKEVRLSAACSVSLLPFRAPRFYAGLGLVRAMLRSVDQLHVFTKPGNFNKLYVDNSRGLFLSPGIILKFMKKDEQRFLKKRLRT
jgi:hypothetical protein